MKNMNEVQEIEIDIDTLKRQIALDEALERLENNVDYQKVIQEVYLEQEPARLILFKASPFVKQQPLVLKDVESQIDAIGEFFHFLLTIKQQAESARNRLQENIETREALIEEQTGSVQ